MANDCCKPAKMGSVEAALGDLTSANDYLEQTISELVSSLQVVLRAPEPPNTKGVAECRDDCSQCALDGKIHAEADRTTGANDQLRDVLVRLEL